MHSEKGKTVDVTRIKCEIQKFKKLCKSSYLGLAFTVGHCHGEIFESISGRFFSDLKVTHQ